MAMLSFKSVGKTFEKKVQEFIDIVPTPIGIKTPLQ